MNTAYLKAVINGPLVTREWSNGCPSILCGSEPLFVIRLEAGRLEAFFHFKAERLLEGC